MPPEDTLWLESTRTVAGEELSRMCGLTQAELDELVEYGSLNAPTREGFRADVIAPLRKAVRLRTLFDLDLFTAGLLLQYLSRIEDLECELRALRSRLPIHHAARDGPAPWHEPHA